ncbi:hypothetical protein FVE85_6120 [Porphyridium purpureum]|uniref:DNA-directed RNA polymerase III subunit RPC9 n=1 Tax=Porphyridium purpureum TaxID=35688 RepID=A0A5J4Z5D7_PORPP|nr:hypothetical protein FVE85_6120 [Porphyridium purpureum]|eukprot:POR6001..scf295_1
MKIINPCVGLVSDVEVRVFLEQKKEEDRADPGVQMMPSRAAEFADCVMGQLLQGPAGTQTLEDAAVFLRALETQRVQLSPKERLFLLNIRPSNLVTLVSIVPDIESRMDQDAITTLLQTIKRLPEPPVLSDDEEEDDDGEERDSNGSADEFGEREHNSQGVDLHKDVEREERAAPAYQGTDPEKTVEMAVEDGEDDDDKRENSDPDSDDSDAQDGALLAVDSKAFDGDDKANDSS